MLQQEDIEYCKTQRVRVASITGDDITSLFSKFNAVYPMYNRLYGRLPAALKALGKPLPDKDDDNTRATGHVVLYLTGLDILANWSSKQLDEDVSFINWCLEHRVFHFKLKEGKPVAVRDAELAQQIKSADPDTKVKAILYAIYYVRCNIVHGQKHQAEEQRRLVLAATKLLQAVTDQLYDKLAGVSVSTVQNG